MRFGKENLDTENENERACVCAYLECFQPTWKRR